MSLAARDVISERYRPLAHVYFPLSGMASLVITMRDGSTVEMATIGREGMVGVPMMSRSRATAAADAIVQVAGEVLRMRITAFHSLLEETRRLPVLVARFSEALFQLVGQSAACNRLHSTDQRLSRWLLMTQDRLESVDLPLTHEFLGQMLGVRLKDELDERTAEFAILVRSRLRGHGLGWLLMRRVIEYATEKGLRRVYGDVLSENSAMLQMAEELGFRAADRGSDLKRVVLDLG